MVTGSPSRHLHFHVCHPAYMQTVGYGFFLQHVLERLNDDLPQTVEDLTVRTARLMANQKDENDPSAGKNLDVLAACLPASLRAGFEKNPDREYLKYFFGPVVEPDFGLLQTDAAKIDIAQIMNERTTPDKKYTPTFGTLLSTPINTRSYEETLRQNQSANVIDTLINGSVKTEPLRFVYPIPGTGKSLGFMRLTNCEGRAPLYGEYFSGGRDGMLHWLQAMDTHRHFSMNEEDRPSLYFTHPPAGREDFMKRFHECVRPAFESLTAPLPPEQDPMEKLAPLYWLYAQGTPVVRGGSAMANVVLEHMAFRARQQGAQCDIPYCREGVDLWPHAATQRESAFSQRFVSGEYFDRSRTDEDVQKYVQAQLAKRKAVIKYKDLSALSSKARSGGVAPA